MKPASRLTVAIVFAFAMFGTLAPVIPASGQVTRTSGIEGNATSVAGNVGAGVSGAESSSNVVNGILYIASENRVLAVKPSTGDKVWIYTTGGGVSAPVVVNGVVYVGSTDDRVYALNAATGAEIWSHTTGVASTSPGEVQGKVASLVGLEPLAGAWSEGEVSQK